MSELKLQQCRLDGRYDVLDCLGRGSYAEIYVARDAAASDGSPNLVVIKALNTTLQGSPDAELERTLIENFRNEAMALDRVRHPNVINRLGHGTAIDLAGHTFHYLVLEYMPGGDLQALCRQHALTLERALYYFEQVVAGLEHAHEHQVIHRDIKPSNLLLTADHQTVKIADFGVAKIEAVEGAITRVGTDVYAAPEHHPLARTGQLDTASLAARPVPHLSPAADVYSLAKTTYMLLTGEAPRRFSQRPITELPPSIRQEPWAGFVLQVLKRATQTNPLERYQSVVAFRDELRDATMPGTQPLSRDVAQRFALPLSTTDPSDGRIKKVESLKTAPAAPPPASFDSSPPRPRPNVPLSAHPRIVVPVSPDTPAETALQNIEEAGPIAHVAPEVIVLSDAPPTDISRQPQLSGRARRWLVALLLIAAFAVMLLATHNYVSGLRRNGSNTAPVRRTDSRTVPAQVGSEFVATTDVNLREGPGARTQLIGRIGKGSRVRVLNVIGRWYEVDVVERVTPDDEIDSANRGWLDSDRVR